MAGDGKQTSHFTLAQATSCQAGRGSARVLDATTTVRLCSSTIVSIAKHEGGPMSAKPPVEHLTLAGFDEAVAGGVSRDGAAARARGGAAPAVPIRKGGRRRRARARRPVCYTVDPDPDDLPRRPACGRAGRRDRGGAAGGGGRPERHRAFRPRRATILRGWAGSVTRPEQFA